MLYSKTPGLVDGAGKVLAGPRFQKLALADPVAAPYGVAICAGALATFPTGVVSQAISLLR